MRFKPGRNTRTIALLAIVVVSALLYRAETRTPRPVNVLVLNLCNLLSTRVSLYRPAAQTTPNLDHFADDAFIFRNHIATTSWKSFHAEFTRALAKNPLTPEELARYPELPGRHGPHRNPHQVFTPCEWPHDRLEREIREYVRALRTPGQEPFFKSLLVSMAHPPYSGPNREDIDFKFFNEKTRKLYRDYLEADRSARLLTPDYIPVFSVLFGDRPLLKRSLERVLPGIPLPDDPIGLMNAEYFLKAWKNSAHYKADLELLGQAYDAMLFFSDRELKDIYDVASEPSLRENTVFVVDGGHGYEFMEHGKLHNGHEPYDELIRAPVIVKVPGVRGRHYIDEQVSDDSVRRMILDILAGRLKPANFGSELHKYFAPNVISRNCERNIYSVRSENTWKFLYNLSTEERELYDLRTDPHETRNVADDNPDVAARLEEYLLSHQAEINDMNQIHCPELQKHSHL